MTSEQQAIVDSGKSLSQGLFNNFVHDFTLGLVPDVHTAMIAAVSIFCIYIAFDILYAVMFKSRVDAYMESRREPSEYERYKKGREKSERFRRMYEMDKAGGPVQTDQGTRQAEPRPLNYGGGLF